MNSLRLKSGRELFYARDSDISDGGGSTLPASDLVPGVYEGGLKVWEGAADLCNYLDSVNAEFIVGKEILEFGCGSALPAILCLLRGAKCAVVQDFNDFVIEHFTSSNFRLNGIGHDKWRGVSANWADIAADAMSRNVSEKSADIILTAETIYNVENYAALLRVMDMTLKRGGIILLAAKRYYFGLSACLQDFEDYVRKEGVFETREVWASTEEGVPRCVIQLSRRSDQQ